MQPATRCYVCNDSHFNSVCPELCQPLQLGFYRGGGGGGHSHEEEEDAIKGTVEPEEEAVPKQKFRRVVIRREEDCLQQRIQEAAEQPALTR